MGGYGPPFLSAVWLHGTRWAVMKVCPSFSVHSKNRFACNFLALALFLAAAVAFAQEVRVPREPEKLVERAQKFWALVVSGRRFEALDFVLPDKRNLFLSGNPMPILRAKVVGIDFATDPNHAILRTAVEVLALEAPSGRPNWTITDQWVWHTDNWYLDVQEAAELFPKNNSVGPEVKQIQAQIDQNFEILHDSLDCGRLIQGQHAEFHVPVKYTGDVAVLVSLALPNPLVDVPAGTMINNQSKSLTLTVSAEDWEGPFSLPLRLEIKREAAIVERTLLVKGEVFAPVSFRQNPPGGPIEELRPFSVFIRNNTGQASDIRSISTDSKLDIMKMPPALPAHTEVEVLLRLKPGQTPDKLYLTLDVPLEGRGLYVYRFRNVRR